VAKSNAVTHRSVSKPRGVIGAGLAVAISISAITFVLPLRAESFEELRAAAKKPPKEPDEALALGRSLRRAGLFSDAVRVLKASYPAAKDGALAAALRFETVHSYLGAGQQKVAQKECDGLKAINKGKFELCIAEAQLYWRRGSVALPAAERALGELPGDYQSLVAKGRALGQMGQPKEAEAALREAMAKDQSRYEAHHYAAELFLAGGRANEAVAAARKATQLSPDEPEPFELLGEALPPGADAEKALSRAIAIRPDYGAAHARLGGVMLARGDAARAEQSFRKAVASNPKSADWKAGLAGALLAKGDAPAALKETREALKIVKNHGHAKLVEADALAKTGEIDEAIPAYEAAMGLLRNDPTPLVHAAQACLKAKRSTTAQAFAERAKTTFPKWGPAWEVFGDIAADAKAKQVARDAYKKALAGEGPVDKEALRRKIAAL
jgi:tetratricopeptide (TPR) repeat protein